MMTDEELAILTRFEADMAAVVRQDINKAMTQLRRIRNNTVANPSENRKVLDTSNEFLAWIEHICVRHRARILQGVEPKPLDLSQPIPT